MTRLLRARVLATAAFAVVSVSSHAQGSAEPAPAPAAAAPAPLQPPAPAPVPAKATPPAPAAKAADGKAQLAPVEITGARPDDVQERRNSTASKIIIGREEIDRFGDSTLGDVLKRLPGVTIQGRPGRGGAIRLRGLGNGYTQILLDGERIPPGFSLDSLTPDQIERIEILRAPTAETGARAIAGTINIITRGGYTKRVNDVRVTAGYENGSVQPSVSWTRNFVSGPFIVNYSLTAFALSHDTSATTTTVDNRLDDGTVTLAQRDEGHARDHRQGLHATGRLQWRGDGGVDQVTLTPILIYGRGTSQRDGQLTQSVAQLDQNGVPVPVPYDSSHTDGDGSYSLARLNAQWNRRLSPEARLEWHAGLGRSHTPTHSFRTETTNGVQSRTLEDTSDSHDTSFTASGKLIESIFEDHSLVAGTEVESNRRNDVRTTLQNGQPYLTDFGDNLRASALRFAAYAQDEWNLTSQWAAHAGLRWEGIATRGSVEEGKPDVSNRSSVWSPLLHAVWKPDPQSRDQVRMSLTRSYRSPTLSNLIARPSVNSRYPIPGPNTPTQADRAGNPDLKPELATGIDVAVERYLPGSGLLSANVFRRNITNYMRNVTTLENVSYSSVPRYVSRTQNVGDAVTEGLELEAKFRASELWSSAPRIDFRGNASFFRSRVKGVPGPDNRLDQQPDYTANLGADYRFSAVPLLVGGNLNFTPAYTTRLSDLQTAYLGRKIIADAYGLWTFNPALALRLTFSNLDPRTYVYGGAVDGTDIQGTLVRETSHTTGPTFINIQLRLEMKL
ncbi:MAG: TonB-dependent receptor [Caldimonas sp.]